MAEYVERAKATEFINKCLNHEEELQSIERETLIAVKKYLESIPAADMRPVVHGRWKRVDPRGTVVTFRCSECNYYAHMDATNFCPNCGAKMDEED